MCSHLIHENLEPLEDSFREFLTERAIEVTSVLAATTKYNEEGEVIEEVWKAVRSTLDKVIPDSEAVTEISLLIDEYVSKTVLREADVGIALYKQGLKDGFNFRNILK